jgi:hypothetical protein
VGPRAGLDGCGKSHPHRDSIPGLSNQQRVAVPAELHPSTTTNGYRMLLKKRDRKTQFDRRKRTSQMGLQYLGLIVE